ncbi:unnamed protein product [Rhizoctonia solani]|uniref:Uncharacterized protein n=1 Tax=Rhizoctonia solani TaxID=456999 RepID=A0A8H3AF13_9AGAM|nr:unnamed protein product [Rhizoctonia solani]
MSTGTLSPTLFFDLLSPKPDVTRTSYPATDLIYKLLHHTGADVASFRRNCQVSYRLVEYARDLYDEINTRIHTAEDSGSWESYDAYYRAIDPLEDVLLSIMEVTEVEREEYLIGATPSELVEQSIDSWIKQSISDWLERRKKIRESFDDLRTREELKGFIPSPEEYEIEIDGAKAHDDRTLLQNLLKSIGDNESKVERGRIQNSQMVKKVKDSLQSTLDFLEASPRKSLEEDLSVVTIKCAMAAYGVTEVMKNEEVKPNSALYYRLYSNKIWGTAQKLATNIHDHLKRNDEAPNVSELNKTYAELEAALTEEVLILMPDAYLKLFPLVGKISRAYHAQSLVLASLCHQVASHFENNKSHEAREALEKALDKTIHAFMAAGGLNNKPAANGTVQAVNGASTNGTMSNGTVPSISGEYDKSCEQLYDETLSEIKLCCDVMKMSNDSDLQGKLDEARAKDQARLESYKNRVTKDAPARALVDLTLIVYTNDSNESPFHNLKAQVLQTARLSYIKWLATKELKGVKILHFENPDCEEPEQPMHLDAEIKPLVKDNACTLHLIVQREEPEVNGS